MKKQKALDAVNKEITSCRMCPIDKSGKPVVGEGNPDAAIVFVGEAPGKQEAETGRPFIGRSGQLLRKMIREIGLDENEVYITSPVKYLPNKGTPSSKDIAHGRMHLMKQLDIINPEVVVLLGRVAAEGVLQKKVFVSKEHGQVLEEKDGVKYFLTIHPAAVLRFPNKYKTLLMEDCKQIQKMLRKHS